jgi:hypothetical protein
MSFSIGDKIVCIDSSMRPEAIEELKRTVPNWIVQDEKYTIRGFQDNDGIALGILLEEVTNPLIYIPLLGRVQEPAFAEWRFRKLAPNESMVEVVQEVLEMV